MVFKLVTVSPRTWIAALNLALVVAIGYAGGMTTGQAFGAWLAAHTPQQQQQAGPQQRPTPRPELPKSEFQAILDANVFHAKRSELAPEAALPTATATAAPTAPPPPPELNVTLTGVMITPHQRFAMVVGPTGRQEEVYRIGECLPAGEDHPTRQCQPAQGKLTRVNPHDIKVLYQGRTLVFELTDETAQKPTRPVPRRAVVRPPVRRPEAQTAEPAGGDAFPATRSGNVLEVRVPNAEVEKSFENFSDILRQARVVPYNSEDLNGFQIRRIQPNSIFQRIGLQNMDVIKAVNGESITTADQALRLLSMFRNEKEIQLDIRRRNEDLQINYLIE